MDKKLNEYDKLLLQLGDIEARINFWKRYRIDPLAQAEVIHLKDIKKQLEREFKIVKNQLRV